MKRKPDKDAAFVFARRLVVCKSTRCRKSCHCKGVGFYYSLSRIKVEHGHKI